MTPKDKLEKAIAALAWYAQRENYNDRTWRTYAIEFDMGERARKTLGEIWRDTQTKKARNTPRHPKTHS